MPSDQGMLLDFKADRDVAIWMKNTYIPLDLIYIDRRGLIVYLHRGAVPHSEESIRAGASVRAVLEVNAGQIDRHGLSVGDTVVFRSFRSVSR